MRRSRGFTLIELLVTVAIVALLSTLALPLAEVVARREREVELKRALREIRSALDAYVLAVEEGRILQSVDGSAYPESLTVLVEGVPDATSPDGKKMLYFLRRIPRDPLAADPTESADKTWGKRSYASSHDAPEEGEDVYDVYSLAPGVGLNGVPYRQW